jgi:hypothetical protein
MYSLEDERPSDSPFIEKVWVSQSVREGTFTSTATIYSEIVVTKFKGQTTISIRGPETKATTAIVPAEAEFLGIIFKPGTFMPSLLPKNLLDLRDVHVPASSDNSFWFNGSLWEIPTFDNADTFIERLVRAGLLVHDPVVSAVLQGEPPAYSPRTLQYRFARATGLTYKAIQQITRAQQAIELLKQGKSIIDTAHELGYFDQSHLTNSLKRFFGQTPAQIVAMREAVSQPK